MQTKISKNILVLPWRNKSYDIFLVFKEISVAAAKMHVLDSIIDSIIKTIIDSIKYSNSLNDINYYNAPVYLPTLKPY